VRPPEAPPARPAPPAEAPAAAPPAGPNPVLVVDDDPSVRELVARVLTREGYQVHAAADGPAGLDLARRVNPRAIVLDALMPGMDGWAVLAALKADPATAAIPVIMASIVDDKSRGFALGVADYVTKPIDWARLGAVLRAHRVEPAAGPVLLVEDDAAAREMTARHLRSAGFDVMEAPNGRAALDRLRERRPAVVLLDLLMPEMDGFAFAESLRHEEAGRGVPVVVVTAAELTPEDRARLAGSVQQVLRKGEVTPEQLLAEVRERVRACVV
jgi:CheY-like chemotaxis protein